MTHAIDTTLLFDRAPMGIAIAARDGRLIDVNPALAEMAGRSREWLLDHALGEIVHPDDLDEVRGAWAWPNSTQRELACRLRCSPDGLVDAKLHAVALDGHDGSGASALLFLEDVSERLATEGELARRATHDGLTGLPNRTMLLDRLNQATARRNRDGSPLAVLFLDIDGFKAVNDALGHLTGDAVLAGIACDLEHALRPGDSIARYGGDEFVVMCERTGWAEAETIASRLATVAWTAAPRDGVHSRASVSVGLTVATGSRQVRAKTLIERADADMYRVKRRRHGGDARLDGARPAGSLPPQSAG